MSHHASQPGNKLYFPKEIKIQCIHTYLSRQIDRQIDEHVQFTRMNINKQRMHACISKVGIYCYCYCLPLLLLNIYNYLKLFLSLQVNATFPLIKTKLFLHDILSSSTPGSISNLKISGELPDDVLAVQALFFSYICLFCTFFC